MKKHFILSILCTTALSLVFLCSCNDNDSLKSLKKEYEIIDIPTRSTIELSPKDIKINQCIDDMSIELLRHIIQNPQRKDHNVVFSPLGLFVAMSMAANSFDDDYNSALQNILGYEDLDDLNETANKLIRFLPDKSNGANLLISNSVWYDPTVVGNPSNNFKNRIANYYSEVYPADFSCKPYECCEKVNKWCNIKTNGLIPNIYNPESLDETIFMIINAIYFKDQWKKCFDTSKTYRETFYGEDGNVSVDMMRSDNDDIKFLYEYLSPSCSLIGLPFKGNYTMYIIAPRKGHLLDNIEYLKAENLLKDRNQISNGLSLPKLDFESDYQLSEFFGTIGLPSGTKLEKFGQTNASGPICGKVKGKFKMDENGVEAACITSIKVDSAPILINEPFYFSIVNNITGTSVMMGYVGQP